MRYSQVFILLLFLGSCVSPYDINSSEYRETIVIQGMITDQPGPYLVQVSNAIPINLQTQETGAISGATVVIEDDQGNSERLVEKTPGNYYTSTFQGIIGHNYILTVTTSEGNVYQSVSETLNPVGDFTLKDPEFTQNEDTYANMQVASTNGFNLYIDAEVLPEQNGRVWWRWSGTFHVFTQPELQTTLVSGAGGAINVVPDPPKCSGYVYVKPNKFWGGGLVQISPCTCCDCWYSQYNQIPLISDTRFINNGSIKNFNVAFVEVNRRTFYDKYFIEIEQLSVSENVYGFWKNIKIQRGNSSNLFQVPPPRTTTNIKSLNLNAAPVIGYFAASSVKKHSLVLNRSSLPSTYNLMAIDTIKRSCSEVYKNSTINKPSFW
ncbi:MAG: DUF4249 domain-containing protein [Bacteroidetes bacterium]|nr:DUF4249 domain-containing protein [Bacteroidota bacterium]